MNTVPTTICRGILGFCATITGNRPQYVKSRPTNDAVQGFCFDNVSQKVKRAGGSIVYGWAIWHMRGLYYEAEHHGVWQNRSGKLVDVSPQFNNAPKILFLPDSSAIYDPTRFRTNIIQAEKQEPLVIELVDAAQRKNAILDNYRKPRIYSANLSRDDQVEFDFLDNKIRETYRKIMKAG